MPDEIATFPHAERRRSDETETRGIRCVDWIIIAVLIVGTLALYARTYHYTFINFDDQDYVSENPRVLAGLSMSNAGWAFTSGFASNWHPLTWLSLMLDVQLFGVNPGAIHLESAIIHSINAALLFVVLVQMTGARWPAAWVTGMFAWHPLHVESVAWISERKDVLSTLFMMLTMLAYVRYVKCASFSPRVHAGSLLLEDPEEQKDPACTRGLNGGKLGFLKSPAYLIALGMLALGLMAKPMLVTLPAVLLLLDFWPLKRFEHESIRSLIIEKLPMFGVVAVSAVVTFCVQSATSAVAPIKQLSLMPRVTNALCAYEVYLRKMIVPRGLAVFYPLLTPQSSRVVISFAILTILTIGAIAVRKRAPWVLVGWLWYLGTLVPVIGLVQVGSQSHADRYTYIPLIGIFVAMAWSVWAFASTSSLLRSVATCIAIGTLAAAGAVCWQQIAHWENSITLWRHAIDVDPNNYAAHSSLGQALDDAGDPEGAAAQYHEALRIWPNESMALNNLAVQAMKRGEADEAIKLYKHALWADPNYIPAYNNYGNLLMKKGRSDDAVEVYRTGIAHGPSVHQTYQNLAVALASAGKIKEAIPLWQQALQLNPAYSDAHASYGTALVMTGQAREGILHLRESLRTDPDRTDSLNTLAWTLATHPNQIYQDGKEAQRLAARAVELTDGENPMMLDALAAAQARVGKFDDAMATAQRAIDAASKMNPPGNTESIERRLELYKSHEPFTSGQ